MSEPLVQMVAGQPRPRLIPLVAGYTGYRIEEAEPGVHRVLPSRHLTFIVTLDGTVDLATMPDPTDNTPAPTVWPCLSYSDEQAAIRFLVEAFGFEETLAVPDGRPLLHEPRGSRPPVGEDLPGPRSRSRWPGVIP